MDAQWFSGVTALTAVLTALAAVLVTPLVSIYVLKRQTATTLDVALRQIRASVISANRQRWIDQLRDQLSELITLLVFVNMAMRSNHGTDQEIMEKIERAHMIETKINLFLNPKEEDHIKLVALIRAGVEEIFKEGEQIELGNLHGWQDAVVSLSQEILKREWGRVKEGD